MPQIDCYLSNGLDVAPEQLIDTIERCLNEHDQSSGLCKIRVHMLAHTKPQHLFIDIKLLQKAHRTDAWIDLLQEMLFRCLKAECALSSHVAIQVGWLQHYRS